jgi:hypothetical protein
MGNAHAYLCQHFLINNKMQAIQIISQDLFDKVRSRFSNLEMGDETGAVTIDPAEARFFDFDFVLEGNNLGRVSISLNDLGSLKVYYSQGITENQDDPAKKEWYSFLKEMRFFAMRRLLRFDTRDIAKTNLDKNDFQHLATTQGPKEEPTMNTMNETKKIRKGVSENTGRELTNTPRDQFISRMSPSVDNNALLQKVGKVVNSPEFNSDTILQIVDSPNITHPVGLYIQKEFDELQYDLGRAYEDHPEEVAEKLLSMLKDKTQQGLQEGRWNQKSTKKTSRAVKGQTEVIVRHAKSVDEMYPGARSQKKNIKAIFIQNHDGERFKYPFIHPAGAFAMAQHVDHGGIPHDSAGKAIINMSEQIAQLQEFQRKIHRATLHDDATGITERALGRLNELKARVDALGKRHHYESWMAEFSGQAPMDDGLEMDEVTMEQYKQKFTQTNFQEELAEFFPLLHRIMSETDTIDLDSYVSEDPKFDPLKHVKDPTKGEKKAAKDVKRGSYADRAAMLKSAEADGRLKEEDAFENWAEAVEQGKLADDQIEELKNAIMQLPQGNDGPKLDLGPEGQTAVQFFQEFGLDDSDLEDKLKDMANVDPTTDALEVLKLWSNKDYPELAVALGMSDTGGQPEQGQEEPAAENEEQGGPANTMMSKENVIREVAKLVKSRFNEDNPEVGPFNGAPNIALDVKKKCAEMFGEEVGDQAEQLAMEFMEKLSKRWEEKHGTVQDDGLARLKELLGNVKSKVESMGDVGGHPGNNIMSAEDDKKETPPFDPPYKTAEPHKDQYGNPVKHVAKHLAKQGMKQAMDAKEDILKLAGLAK